jgi:nitroimidazol reductase NimA-like FMN-containing flavoprotein (pyridoxamine 5'-phosphate oxidase superfamily)
MPSGPTTDASRVRRLPQRAAYDDATINAILDEGLVGHVGFVAGERAVVIPMLYGRDGDAVYLHGSVASRLQRSLATGVDGCLTVTLIDGLVLARSAFHHSMNYRSAVVFGRATSVEGAEKAHGVEVITEHLLAGRWAESRIPNEAELKVTSVARLEVIEASAKIRTGGPVDDEDDLSLPVWAGVLPCSVSWGLPVAEADVPPGVDLPASLLRRVARNPA